MRREHDVDQYLNAKSTPKTRKLLAAIDLLTYTVLGFTLFFLIYYLAFGDLKPMAGALL